KSNISNGSKVSREAGAIQSTPFPSWQLTDLTVLFLLGIGATISSNNASKIGAILGPKNAELMGLGPKWGHKKSYEKPRLAVGY
ncbi:hypothetical protein, partial [Aeromonas caviae]|uniref:hypothetical protein n=1 Tax=Aeromonas caviae TaxID=648 RepID=UPI002B461392